MLKRLKLAAGISACLMLFGLNDILQYATSTQNSAQAATWKKGMPKALRGKWAYSVKKLPKSLIQKGSGSYRLTIVRRGIISNYFTKNHNPIMPELYFTQPRYHKIGKNTYRFRGNYSNSGKSGIVKNKPLQIVKQGNKIKYKKSFSAHSKYSRWLYKF